MVLSLSWHLARPEPGWVTFLLSAIRRESRLGSVGRAGRAIPVGSLPRGHFPSSSSPPTVERGQKIAEQIVIGTPGTVLDWCSKLKFIDPKKIRVFVLDEADVMIATQGHQDQSIRIQR